MPLHPVQKFPEPAVKALLAPLQLSPEQGPALKQQRIPGLFQFSQQGTAGPPRFSIGA